MSINGFGKIMVIISILLFFPLPIPAQSYVEMSGNDKTSFTYQELLTDNEIKITLSRDGITEICIVDSKYHCRSWVYKNNNGYEFTAVRKTESIEITGKRNSKSFHHSILIGTEPWLQFWEYGIRNMILNHETNMRFYSIDANKPEKEALFIANLKGEESVTVDQAMEKSLLVTVRIKGLPTMLFSGKLWFRVKDKVFIKSEMPQGPFVPETKIEIRE